MKKSIRSFALFGVCALSLTACGEASFADFKSKGNAALKKTVEYKTAEVSGTSKSTDAKNNSETKVDVKLNVSSDRIFTPSSSITSKTYADEFWYVAKLATKSLAFFTAPDEGNSAYKYYAGSTFKVVFDSEEDGTKFNNEFAWNDVGLITTYKTVVEKDNSKFTYNLTVKYSK